MKTTGTMLVLLLSVALGACETRSTSDTGIDSVEIQQLIEEAWEDTTNREMETLESDRGLEFYRKQQAKEDSIHALREAEKREARR